MKHLLDWGTGALASHWATRLVATEDRRRGYRAALRRPESFLIPLSSRRRSQRSPPAVQPPKSYSISPNRPPRSSRSTTTSQSARFKLLARGLRVPEDLSVVGFDDVEHATIVTPALTTVRQPLAEMGRTV